MTLQCRQQQRTAWYFMCLHKILWWLHSRRLQRGNGRPQRRCHCPGCLALPNTCKIQIVGLETLAEAGRVCIILPCLSMLILLCGTAGPYSPEVLEKAASPIVPTPREVPSSAPRTPLDTLNGFRAMLEKALQEGVDGTAESTQVHTGVEGSLFDDDP